MLSLIGLLVIGLKFSIDFSGGAVLRFDNASGASIGDYQDALAKYGLKDSTVEFINGTEVQIRTEKSLTAVAATPTPSGTSSERHRVEPDGQSEPDGHGDRVRDGRAEPEHLGHRVPPGPHHGEPALRPVARRQSGARITGGGGRDLADDIDEQDVGPTWGSQISAKALQGLLIFLVLVSVYISLRFEPKMAGAALIALAHDLIITAGIYALVGREVTRRRSSRS